MNLPFLLNFLGAMNYFECPRVTEIGFVPLPALARRLVQLRRPALAFCLLLIGGAQISVTAQTLESARPRAVAGSIGERASVFEMEGNYSDPASGSLRVPAPGRIESVPARDFGAADLPVRPRADAVVSRSAPARETSQFQRFVQENTGSLLHPYGIALFDNPQAYSPDSAAPAPAEYVLGPGDEVRIHVWGRVDYSGSHTIDRNGQISLPKIGAISLNGAQVKDLERVVARQVAMVFTNVQVNASLGRLRGITVYVVGHAQRPGAYALHSLSTLVNAIFASGGPTAHGSMRQIRLQRAGRTVATLDLYDFIKGDHHQDTRLQPGDVIAIPPAGPRIALTGATDHSAIYELAPAGGRLGDVLALGGGVPVLAKPQKALIETLRPDNPRYPREVKEVALDETGLAQSLRDGDIVRLLPLTPAQDSAVTLAGAVAQPLRHRWTPGMRVLDLIPSREALLSPTYYRRKNQLLHNSLELLVPVRSTREAGAAPAPATEQINWDYALIERLNPETLRTDLIPFHLSRALTEKDPAHNLSLQPGDIVTIFSSAQLRLPVSRQSRLVRLEGEVAAPGIYQALAGETLPQLIKRAGGLTPQAYLFGMEFTREGVRRQQQQNLDRLVQELESQLQGNAVAQVSNATGDRAAQAVAVQQAQQAQTQAQIQRLRNLKSQGRVSLELSPRVAAMAQPALAESTIPPLPLEDGDSVLVPPVPAFVAVVGSVHNENVFIHRDGKTVGDVLGAAGMTEYAEPSEVFVLRADGSIISRKAQGFFRLSSFESMKLMPGDTVVVPAMMDRESRYNFLVRALRDWTQIFSNFGIGVAALRTLTN